MNREFFTGTLGIMILFLSFSGCRKDDGPDAFNLKFPPAFSVYHAEGNIGHIFARCLDQDIILDTVEVTDPINQKYTRFFNGQKFNAGDEIDLGDTFVPSPGRWTFIFRGRRQPDLSSFDTYKEAEF